MRVEWADAKRRTASSIDELFLSLLLGAFNPYSGITARVEAPNDDDVGLLDDVIQRVREPAEDNATNLAMNDTEGCRVFPEYVERLIDGFD
jgi:hypothetical protein